MPQKRYNCMHSTLIPMYKRIRLQLRTNYETFTVVLRIKIRQLRNFLRLRLRRNTLRYVNFFLAPTVYISDRSIPIFLLVLASAAHYWIASYCYNCSDSTTDIAYNVYLHHIIIFQYGNRSKFKRNRNE